MSFSPPEMYADHYDEVLAQVIEVYTSETTNKSKFVCEKAQ